MPRYDYKCDTCGYVEETEHPMAEDYNGELCWTLPQDHLETDEIVCFGLMNRVFQATPAHFKGQGWANIGPTYKSPKGQD